MFTRTPGKYVDKKYSVSYYKVGEGDKVSYFSRLDHALEYYQEKKEARRQRVQLQLMTTVTTIEVLDAKELINKEKV